MGAAQSPQNLDRDVLPAPTVEEDADTRGHSVRFYEDDSFLVETVVRLIGDGLEAGEAGVVVATRAHLEDIAKALTARGLDLDTLRTRGRYVAFNAVEMLSSFMVGGQPDGALFTATVGEVIRRAAEGSPRGFARAFGEMVSVLWMDGNSDAAIALEELWEKLLQTYSFSLCCGYPLNSFSHDAGGAVFLKICAKHSRVIPAETYSALRTTEERLRSVSALQQQAKVMETEAAGRRRAEKSLSLRERELADFLENAVEGLHQIGPDQRILWANNAQLELLGYSAEEYVGHQLGAFFVEHEVFEEFWRQLMRGEIVYDFAAALRGKDGAVRQVLIHSSGLWDNGRFLFTRCFIRDVTERMRLQHELQERLAERELADRQKNQFLAMLGHELRNPMAAVINAIAIVQRQGAGAPSALAIAQRQAGHLARLVDDLLDIGRITQGRIALRKEPLFISKVVQHAVDDARFLAEPRSHQLVVSIEPGIEVEADPVRMRQIIQNLLHNAIKFTPPGGTVEMLVRRDGDEVEIRVRDNGAGIAPDMLGRVFDLFSQAEPPLDRSSSGLGMGLTLVKHIVEMHGGRVLARSEGLGRGSEFEVRLPSLRGAPHTEPARDARAAPGAARVLIVEDNSDAAEVLALLLTSLGHQVQVAGDGYGAIEAVGAGAFDAVLVDIGLPGIDGYEVARRIRSLPDCGKIVLAALTGYGQDEDRQRALAAGFDHHLTKPVKLERLQAILAATR